MIDVYMSALGIVFSPFSLFAIVVGVGIGLTFGAIPGLSGVTAVGLLVPFTYAMDPSSAILMMVGVYCAATMSGAITAILFNIPGDVMAVATTFDGHPMAARGEAKRALSMVIFGSVIGGLFGALALATIAPQLARVAVAFGPAEFFALAVLGLTAISVLGAGNPKTMLKAILSVLFGLFLATIGSDPVSGASRFAFGNVGLEAGLARVPAIIGLFALGEVLAVLYMSRNAKKPYDSQQLRTGQIFSFPSREDLRQVKGTLLRAPIVGTIIGILPGSGGTLAALIGYNVEQRFAKDPKSFGKGNIQGVAAPESANNAAVGGSMVPLLTLGIPGSSTTAIMLAALTLHGLRPGPLMFRDNPEMTYAIIFGLVVANLIMLVMALLLVRYLLKVLLVRTEVLCFIIVSISLVGAFAIHNRIGDMWIAFVLGLIGFFVKKYGFSLGGIILGLVLGNLAEDGLILGLSLAGGDWWAMVTRPVTFSILLLSVLLFLTPIAQEVISRRRAARAEDAPSPPQT
jgi:putative tricarboxylic transport membrane protein